MFKPLLALALWTPVSAFADEMPAIGPCRGVAIHLCRALDGDGQLPIWDQDKGHCGKATSPLLKAACYGMANDKSGCDRYAKEHGSGAEKMCDDMVELGQSMRDGQLKPQTSCGVSDSVVEKFCIAVGTATASKCPDDPAAEGCEDFARLLDGIKTAQDKIRQAGASFAEQSGSSGGGSGGSGGSDGSEAPSAPPPPKVLLTVELKSFYKLSGSQSVKVLLDGATGAKGDLDVAINGNLTRAVQMDTIPYWREGRASDDVLRAAGFTAADWPTTIAIEYGSERIPCGTIGGSARDVRLLVTWSGMTVASVTGSPVSCEMMSR
jgi:hypothetical protein